MASPTDTAALPAPGQHDDGHEQDSRRVIGFVNAAHFLDHYVMLILPTAVLGMGADFGASYGTLMGVAFLGALVYGIGSLPVGWAADRFAKRHLLTLFLATAGVATAATALAATPAALMLGLAAIGATAAIYHPVGGALLAENAGQRIGRVVGVNGVCGNAGVACAPLLTGALTDAVGWRWAFVVPGLACLALAALHHWRAPPAHSGGGGRRATTAAPIPLAVARRAFAITLVAQVAGGLVFAALPLLLPKLLDERVAWAAGNETLIGVLAFLVTMFGATAQLLIGYRIDRLELKRVYLPLGLLLAPALGLLSISSGLGAVLCAAAAIFAIFGQVTANETMVARYVAPAWRARAYAVRYFVSFLAGSTAPRVIGDLHNLTGAITASVVVLFGCGLVMLGCAILFPLRREEVARPAPIPSAAGIAAVAPAAARAAE